MAESKSSKSGKRDSKSDGRSDGKSGAGQAGEASGSPVPGGVQVPPSAGSPRRTLDVEGNPVDEPLD